jgi:uncharacterized protein YqjF (DUF2071 family)
MSGPMPQNTIRLPVNAQRWSALTFLHWPVAPALIQERLPRGLHVQTYEGAAWIGLTPFLMQDLRMPPLPAVPGWSSFPEVNLRTYVCHDDGTDGLWFLGLWSTRRAMNAAMRTIGLPYHRTEATLRTVGGGGLIYDARPARHAVPLRLRVAVWAGESIGAPTELEGRLTGRWNACTARARHVWGPGDSSAMALATGQPGPPRHGRLRGDGPARPTGRADRACLARCRHPDRGTPTRGARNFPDSPRRSCLSPRGRRRETAYVSCAVRRLRGSSSRGEGHLSCPASRRRFG